MNNVKEQLVELGFKEEEIGFVPYLIFYKYKYSFKAIKNEEYEITVILYSNGSFEIQKQSKEHSSEFHIHENTKYCKGKISELNPLTILEKLLNKLRQKGLLGINRSSNLVINRSH